MKNALIIAACLLSANGVAFADEASTSETTTTQAAPVASNTTQTRSHTSVHQGPLGTSVHQSKSTVNSTNVAPGATTTSTESHTSVNP